MNDDTPGKTYWWVRHRRDGNVEIALHAGAWWYAAERSKSYSTDPEIRREYELLEPAPVPVFREELRYACRKSQSADVNRFPLRQLQAEAAVQRDRGDWVNAITDATHADRALPKNRDPSAVCAHPWRQPADGGQRRDERLDGELT